MMRIVEADQERSRRLGPLQLYALRELKRQAGLSSLFFPQTHAPTEFGLHQRQKPSFGGSPTESQGIYRAERLVYYRAVIREARRWPRPERQLLGRLLAARFREEYDTRKITLPTHCVGIITQIYFDEFCGGVLPAELQEDQQGGGPA